MNNYEKAYKLYEKGGYSLVIDACNDSRLKYDKWGMCKPCESNQPIHNNYCLVCGAIYTNREGV